MCDYYNFFSDDNRNRKTKIADFQDLDHIEGVSISTVSANLYDQKRDDLVLFYFRDGVSYASVFTQSKIVSENIKWNQKIKSKKLIIGVIGLGFDLLVSFVHPCCCTCSLGTSSRR